MPFAKLFLLNVCQTDKSVHGGCSSCFYYKNPSSSMVEGGVGKVGNLSIL